MGSTQRHQKSMQRRGAVAVLVVILAVVVIGFTALVVDVGMLYAAKADLQGAADAAAMAAVSAYIDDDFLKKNQTEINNEAVSRAQEFGLSNRTLNQATTVEVADIAFGRHDFADPTGPLSAIGDFNAVDVTTRRTSGSSNGPVPFFFARIWGHNSGDVTATSRAAVDDRFRGVDADEGPPLIPLTIDVAVYEQRLAAGTDEFSFDGSWVISSADSISESKLFPEKVTDDADLSDDVETAGAGNLGLINIDGNGNSVQLGAQFRDNISPTELINEFGTPDLVYSDDTGNPVTYSINGSTGLKASLEFDMQQRIGQVVGFFVHDSLTGNGSNTVYNNVGLRFGRLMEVTLNGNPKRVVVQPVVYTSPSVIVGGGGSSSGGLIVGIQLVQ